MGIASGFSKSFKAGSRVKKEFSLSSSESSVNEGGVVTLTLNAKKMRDGQTVGYTISGISSTDLSVGSLTGSFTVNGGVGIISLTLRSDSLTEGLETMRISLSNGRSKNDISVIDTSLSGPTYSVSHPSSVNEGSSLSVSVTTSGVANGTVLYWTALNSTTSSSDFSSLSGSFIINSNSGSFSVPISADLTTEGVESFRVQIRTTSVSGAIVRTSSLISINDTSLTPSQWTPSNFANIHTWVDFGDSTSYAVDARGDLTSVDDKAGNVSFYINNTPNIGVQTLNGMDVMYFDGTENLEGRAPTQVIDSNGNHFSVSLWKVTGVDDEKDSMWSYYNSNAGNRDYAISSRNISSWLGEIDLGNGTTELGTVPWLDGIYMNNWIIYSVVFDKEGNKIFARANGVAKTNVVPYSLSLQNDLLLRIGANRNGNKKVQGFCAEFISAKSTPGKTSSDIAYLEMVEGYMAHRWGIQTSLPVSHTYRYNPPTTQP